MSQQSTSRAERSLVRRLSRHSTVLAALLLTLVVPQAYAQAAGSCTPTAIMPNIQVDGRAWQNNISTATVAPGSTVNLGPQPLKGTWKWTGPNGFTSASRQINDIPLSAGANTYVATYT